MSASLTLGLLQGYPPNTFRVEYVAPGHRTGEPAFVTLRRAFGDRYLYARVGTTLDLPQCRSEIVQVCRLLAS